MNTDDFQEWQQLRELYRIKSDVELELLAKEAYELTDLAKQTLQDEISSRRLNLKLTENSPEPEVSEGPVEYSGRNLDRELDLVTATTAFSREEAERLDRAFECAGIAHFFGAENVVEAADITSSFSDGVRMKVRYADQGRAISVLNHLMAENPEKEEVEEIDENEGAVICPGCKSPDPVFLEANDEPPESPNSKFHWKCEACGHVWTDDGVGLGRFSSETGEGS